jgi:uncharacterized protein (TIGR02597 family)
MSVRTTILAFFGLLTQSVFSGYDIWKNSGGLSTLAAGEQAQDADPDKDGLANLVEYVLGGNPVQADAMAVSPVLDVSTGSLGITFVRMKAAGDASFTIEPQLTTNLGDPQAWATDGTTFKGALQGIDQSNLPDGKSFASSAYERVQVIANSPMAGVVGGKQFLRLGIGYEEVVVTTPPVGFITLTVRGTDNSTGLSAVSVPMLTTPLHTGVISGVNGMTITDSNATWTTGDFATPDPNGNPSHYIEITSHSDAAKVGLIHEITASDGGNKTLAISGNAAALNGSSYVIRKCRTLGGIFGDANESGLTAGSSSSADIIYKIGVDGGGDLTWQIYYYQEAPGFAGGNGWRQLGKAANADMKDVSILPHEGLIIKRRSGPDKSVTLTGSVRTGNSHTSIRPGLNLVSHGYPVDYTLEQLGLHTGNPATGLDSTVSTTNDAVYNINDSGRFEIFYHQQVPALAGGNGWRKFGLGTAIDQKDSVIPAGRSIVIRRLGETGFTWTTTVPF